MHGFDWNYYLNCSLWLNEGFATYVENLGADLLLPQHRYLKRVVAETLHGVLDLDSLETSHPLSFPNLENPNEIEAAFDSIAYQKGASIIRMMSNFLGEKTFNKGIEKYLKTHQYANANQDDLWACLSHAATQDKALNVKASVKAIMDTWTLQMNYPVVTVIRDPVHPNRFRFRQRRFLLYRNNNTKTSDETYIFKWWVPISYAGFGKSFNHTKPKFWLSPYDKGRAVVQTINNIPPHEPLIVNVQQTGYYRVNYDRQTWGKIINCLHRNHKGMHVQNRAQILDDAFSLAKAGLLDYNIALNISTYLHKEEDPMPLKVGIHNIGFVTRFLTRTESWADLSAYVSHLLKARYLRYRQSPRPDETFEDKDLRQLAVGVLCGYGHPDCINDALDHFNFWFNANVNNTENTTSINQIPIEVRENVYCIGVQQGSEKEWEFVWRESLKTTTIEERERLRKALACSTELWLLTVSNVV